MNETEDFFCDFVTLLRKFLKLKIWI
jgi:hypothetical protein